jgi:hypothetical protein
MHVCFRIIDFIEKLALILTTLSLVGVLEILSRSLFNLKADMKQLREQEKVSNESAPVNDRQLQPSISLTVSES